MASNTKKTLLIIFAVVAAVAVVVLTQIRWAEPAKQPSVEKPSAGAEQAPGSDNGDSVPPEMKPSEDDPADAADEENEPEPTKTEDELREEAEEKAVDSFDALVDRWMEKEGGETTMKDADEFVALFKSVPAARKEECLQRALNLVSDEHVLLLAGVLFDKSIDKELVELVFNDVLNRDESVKKLLLPMIYKDKTHPCWADTAWILDVTGETPKKENDK